MSSLSSTSGHRPYSHQLILLITIFEVAIVASAFMVNSTPPRPLRLVVPTESMTTSCILSSISDEEGPSEGSRQLQSRLMGNSREPTEEELVLMDEMITKLSEAKLYELPNAVKRAFRVVSSPQFFLRIAELTDRMEDPVNKERLSALATNLVSTLEAVVSTMEERLDERAVEVEGVVKMAAEPDSGEFLVPLLPERIQAMRNALQALPENSLDEGFLSTLDAWMNKSHKDGMDLMVNILQKVLQMYAGTQISRALARQPKQYGDDQAAATLLEELLETDAESWDAVLLRPSSSSSESLAQVLALVQKTMEAIVLSLEAGSMAQQVQAEYLQELSKRIETAQQKAGS